MCSEERYSECPGGLWRPGIGFSALLASYRGRAGMSSAQGRLKMRFSGRTKKFRVWPPCRHNTIILSFIADCVGRASDVILNDNVNLTDLVSLSVIDFFSRPRSGSSAIIYFLFLY